MLNKRYICRVRPPFRPELLSPACTFSEPEQTLGEWYAGQAFLFGALRQGLEILLRSLRPGKVVLSDFNCSSMLVPISRAGCVPYFVDVDLKFRYRLEQLDTVLHDDDVVAVVITHYFGCSAWTGELLDWAQRAKSRGIAIVEDCAHSLMDEGRKEIGRVGDASLFSFGNDKPLSVGKGGALVVRNERIADSVARLCRNLPVRDDLSESLQLLWHVVFSWLVCDKNCFPGLPCEAPKMTVAKDCDFEAVFLAVARMGLPAIKGFGLSMKMLSLGEMQSQTFLRKALKRLCAMTGSSMGMWKTFDLSEPSKMGARARQVLAAYLTSGVVQEENAGRCVMMKRLSELLQCKMDEGVRLRFTHVFDNPSQAMNAVQVAQHAGVEAGGFNWRPCLSRLILQKRPCPDWAVRPDCVVNFPMHMGLLDMDLQTIARAVNVVNDTRV